MPIDSHLSAEVEHLGRAYDFELIGVRTQGRSEIEVAENIASVRTEFDCFLINRSGGGTSSAELVTLAVARCVRGWVEIFGTDAEAIHDAVDQASVRIGRQTSIGDGDPMTAWNSVMTDDELAKYIATGGQGDCGLKAVVYFADGSEEALFYERLKNCLNWRRRK